MKIARLALALGLLTTLFLARAPAARAGAEVKKSERGMTYSLRVPAGWKGGRLVVGLHGQGGSNAEFMPLLEASGFLNQDLLVAPNATAGAAWEEPDIDMVADLIREVRVQYHVTRALVFGFSRGAYMSYGLGLRHPEVVQGVIAHSGGLVVPVPDTDAAKRQIFCIIHGDADPVVPVEQSREAIRTLKAGGLSHLTYDEIPRLAHAIDRAAVKRGLEWVEGVIAAGSPTMTDGEAAQRIAALEAALKAKDDAAAAVAFGKLEGAPRSAASKIAKLAGAQVLSSAEPVAIAAVGAAARLGEAGIPALKAGLKAKPESVEIAAAGGLADVGGDAAIALLIGALSDAEAAKGKPDLQKALHGALARCTGKSFATAKEWKQWARAHS